MPEETDLFLALKEDYQEALREADEGSPAGERT